MATRDEILRFVAQVEGQEGVKKMGDSFDSLAKSADEADPKARALIDELDRLTKTEAAVKGFAALKAQLQETGDKLFLARQRTKELETEFSNTLEPTKKLEKDLAKARAEVARLAVEQNKQTAALQRAENVIKGAGYDLNQLAKAQADVTHRTQQAINEASEYAATLQKTGTQAKQTGGVLQSLRSAVAGIFAGLSIRAAAEGIKDVALLGDQAEKTRNQFTQLFGSTAAGEKALAGLTKFANDNAQGLDQTRDAAIKLKAFGIDPLNGSLQSLVDENAAMGGSQERLEGTIMAVGQAWAKQKLQGEEILQLVERGVPVWDLLAKVTGKNVGELQKLSEAGKLGRAEISGLLREIGKMNSGAAAKNAETLSGLFTQLSSRVRTFFTDVSNKGPLEFFKQQLRDAIATVDGLAKSNALETWARKVGSAIVSVSNAVVGAGKFVAEYAGALILLAKAYAAVKIGTFITDLASIAASAASAGKGITSLSGAFRALPGNVQIAIALIGLDLAMKGARELGDAIGRNLPATKAWEERTRELNAETAAAAERFKAATASLDRYRDGQVKSAAAVEALTAKEQVQYAQGLIGLEKYLQAQIKYYDALRSIGSLNDEGLQHLANLKARLAEVEAGIKTLQTAASVADGTLRSKLSEGARMLANDLDKAGGSTKALGDTLSKALSTIETDSIAKIGDIGLAVSVVAKESDSAAKAIQGGLATALRQLTGEELLKFQAASVAAFATFKGGATDSAAVLDTTLLVAMEKLGVAPEKFGLGMTAAGKQAVAVFQAITENARATSEQIEAAFTAAVRAASSKEDVAALGAALKAAADQGRISLEGAERAGLALQNRIREIATATDPLADAFGRLGIKSQQALNAARDSARDAFNAIADGARRGKASQEDVIRAFEVYAAAARAAVAQSTQGARDQVEAHLRAEAAARGVTAALAAMGEQGEEAGSRTAAAADDAADSLGKLGAAAEEAADSATKMGQESSKAAEGLDKVASSASQAASVALDMSKAFADAATNAQGLDRITFTVGAEQQEQANQLLESLRQQNAQYDEQAQRLEQLRRQFNYLGDAQLEQIAREQQLLEQNQQRRREQDQQQRQQQQQGSGSGSGASGGGVSGRIQVEVVGKAVDVNTLVKDSQAMDVLTREMARRLENLAGMGGFNLNRR
ncbi:tape measure protein [Tahibacter harae]|uniref:Tape measure protein n=1 Tax=Tahibacter harae TaxID=2963937 RepID=A0ABT1QR23_9GAMM|nr:tape measure protein [Tahibacter harae]MCQ4164706.1 tape measure protein [Tahibacter harae]